jgi:acetyl esterase
MGYRQNVVIACFVLAISAGGTFRVSAQAGSALTTPAEHTFQTTDNVPLKAFVFEPAGAPSGARPAIVMLHGGGWVAGAPDWVFTSARRYAALGLVAIPVQYRLANDSISPIDAFADVCHAFRWVRSQAKALRIDPRRVAASGVSAGGHLAGAAATIGCGNSEGAYGTGGPDALVLWSPALDVSGDGHFRRLLRGRAPVESLSPVEHVRPRMPPVAIVHGEKDTLTPLSGARRFCERVTAAGARCDLHVYPGVGHLLTRNLANQEDDFDPDPVARDDGNTKHVEFLRSLWFR